MWTFSTIHFKNLKKNIKSSNDAYPPINQYTQEIHAKIQAVEKHSRPKIS